MTRGSIVNRSRSSWVVKTLSVFLVCLFAFVSAQAQGLDATVNSTVKDQAGALVAGATVTLIDTATGRETTVTSNNEGFFGSFTNSSHAIVHVEGKGFCHRLRNS